MDWSHILKSRQKSGTFVGRTPRDEDAYFAAFADDPPATRGRLSLAVQQVLQSLGAGTRRALGQRRRPL